jgi:enoyl-CoA hydratase/carnithine racemase
MNQISSPKWQGEKSEALESASVSPNPNPMDVQVQSEVLYTVEDHIATLQFNRPERQNTITRPMLQAITDYLVKANEDQNVRAVIITGSGRYFCAGLDMRGGSGIGEGKASASLNLRNAPPTVLHGMDKPTICAHNGSSAGYGMDLALGCDIRIMSGDSKMAAAFTARGVLPESGGTWILPRLIGWSKAAELIFTGRTLNAAQCLEMGLVSHVVPAEDCLAKARALAIEIASRAPLAVQGAKRLMRMGMDETFDNHVHHVYLQLLPLFQSEDFKEGIRSFMEKRSANFQGK